jgi:hypothetical protein
MSAAARISGLPLVTRRAIAVVLLALALLGAWILLLMPLRAIVSSQQQWRESTARQIAEDRGLVKTATAVRAVASAVNASPLKAKLYDAAGEIAVEDQLQNDLRAALRAGGVEPTTFKVLPGSLVQGLRAHRVEFSSMMTVEQMRAFFLALASQSRFVRVERLRADAPLQQRPDENPRVMVLMEARGYARDIAPMRRVARAN